MRIVLMILWSAGTEHGVYGGASEIIRWFKSSYIHAILNQVCSMARNMLFYMQS